MEWENGIMVSNEMIYYAGLALMGAAVLLAAVLIPIFVFTRAGLNKQLDEDYGKRNRRTGRGKGL